jgi:hypothetical protein
MNGVVTHRERPGGGGEKSIEVRIEDVTLMDQMSLEGMSSDSPGVIEVELDRATRPQIRDLMGVIQQHPGAFEVQIQILPRDIHLPIFVPIMAEPTGELLEQIRVTVPGARVTVHSDNPDEATSEDLALAG